MAWAIVDDPQHTYGTGRYAARAGAIGDNQTSNLRSPVINVTATGALRFNYWISSETAADGLFLFASLNGGPFVQQFSTSGVPLITTNPNYPTSISSVIGVGASTDWDYRSHYSQYGTTLDIVAPSGGGYASITTTDRTGANGYNATDYTSTFSGTSAATPLAAGIGALVLSRNTDLTPADIRAILQNTTDKIGGNNGLTAYDANGFNQFYGYGRVNVESAVEAVPGASGDYNRDGSVDAADYVVWRKTNGTSVASAYAGADGSGNVNVGNEDYTVWRAHFGQTITPPGPGSGSGSTASESTLAATSQDLQESVSPPAVDQNLTTEATTVASAHFNVSDSRLFPTTIAPIGRATAPFAYVHQAHRALLDISVRHDAGLVAWLSAYSFQRPESNTDFGSDGHEFLTGDIDRNHDAADSVFESLESLTGAMSESLVTTG